MSERHIIFDTETTGFEPSEGHRIVEIGALEMVDFQLTGEEFHCYINPERDMPDGAFQVHGLGDDFLEDKPIFSAIAQDFVDFVGDAVLVAHNAPFDMKFIQAELKAVGLDKLDNKIVDTLILARQKFTGQKNNLDMLAERLGVDISAREKHGALLDSQILAEVYLALLGKGKSEQSLLDGTENPPDDLTAIEDENGNNIAQQFDKITLPASDEELQAHQKLRSALGDNHLWKST